MIRQEIAQQIRTGLHHQNESRKMARFRAVATVGYSLTGSFIAGYATAAIYEDHFDTLTKVGQYAVTRLESQRRFCNG